MQSGSESGARVVRRVVSIGVFVALAVCGAGRVAAQPAPGAAVADRAGESFQSISRAEVVEAPDRTASAAEAPTRPPARPVSTVPEPSTGLLIVLGAVACLWAWRRSGLWRSAER
jgi:hypothetical protein